MPVNKTATAAGKKWETTLVSHFREQGWEADRLHLQGVLDEGDVALRHPSGLYVIEAKRTKAIDLAGWVGEAQIEADNYAKKRKMTQPPPWAVISARRNHGVGKAYVVLTVDEWLRQISG